MSRRLSAWFVAASIGAAPQAAGAADPPSSAPSSAKSAGPSAPSELVAIAFLPTVVVESGVKRLPSQDEADLLATTSGLDAALADAAQDLGFNVDLTYRSPADARSLREPELTAMASAMGGVIVSPSVEAQPNGDLEIRLVLADARSRALRVRVERAERDDVAVRAVVMLRDLAAEIRPSSLDREAMAQASRGAPSGVLATPAMSEGRATLAINATLFGGLVGFSIHRSSGSEDPRLLYPLLAVGAGIGLGGAMIVAEEWDVGVADAWYLVSGAWWPTLAGHLIFEGRFGDVAGGSSLDDERWASGLIASAAGLTIATVGLSVHGMNEGGALLAHSGGGLGLVLGGIAELAARGDIYRVPFAGMGYGAGLGWLTAAAAATIARPSPGRVLTLDLGAIVGGLGGAAVASPLLFGDPTPNQQRAWLGVTAGGSLVGAGVAWYMTRASRPKDRAPEEKKSARSLGERGYRLGLPAVGVLGESVVGNKRAPIIGLSLQGMLR